MKGLKFDYNTKDLTLENITKAIEEYRRNNPVKRPFEMPNINLKNYWFLICSEKELLEEYDKTNSLVISEDSPFKEKILERLKNILIERR